MTFGWWNQMRMEAVQVASTAFAAIAAIFAAVSAFASWRATKAAEEDVRLQRGLAGHQLIRSFEQDYTGQYEEIVEALGPWKDPVSVEPRLRRVVHDMCQTLSSIYVARQHELIGHTQAEFVSNLFVDWLRLPNAARIWRDVFRPQEETWPPGFVSYVDERLRL